MATYIYYDVGESDALVQGAEWLQKVIRNQQGEEAENEFVEKFREYHSEHENSRQYGYGPVFDLFVDHSVGLFAAIPEHRGEERAKEVESFFALVISIIVALEDSDHLESATMRLCKLFSDTADQQPELRLRLLMMLYNTFNPTFEIRYRVFKYIIDYSAQASLFDLVLPYFEYLDAWMADWVFPSVDDKRVLYRDISTYMRQIGKRTDAFLHLKKYHLLFQGESEEVLGSDDVKQFTVELIKDAVQLAAVIQFDDILEFDTVTALQKTDQALLVELCRVFFSGAVSDLQDFHSKHSALFTEHGLDIEDAMSKMKLLSLASLMHGRSECSLAEVAAALDEREDNVERWVVRAISEGVIDGRIDQLNHKVLVKSTFQRKFENGEWAFLDSKLTNWIDNLEHVIKQIGDHKAVSN
mmetsp:Transcript_55553/g.156388  ORF Transcript_55553/g.156388 Transcript_55553/m.156388 type:complete len:413 (-) Transcript_55553:187-1425(-)